MPRAKTIDQKLHEYRQKLEAELSAGPRQKPTAQERAIRTQDLLTRAELQLQQSDHRRIGLLLRAARLANAQEDYRAVHGFAAEIVTLCRTRTLGFREAYPILSTLPPQARLPAVSSLPPVMDMESDSEEPT